MTSEALKEWDTLVAALNGKPRVGTPGIRDMDHPCEMYQPTPDADLLGLYVTAPGTGRCDGDGHYLCGGCRELSSGGVEERTDAKEDPWNSAT